MNWPTMFVMLQHEHGRSLRSAGIIFDNFGILESVNDLGKEYIIRGKLVIAMRGRQNPALRSQNSYLFECGFGPHIAVMARQ
mgnify:CR=1 FL=1